MPRTRCTYPPPRWLRTQIFLFSSADEGRSRQKAIAGHGAAFRAVLRDKADDAVLGQIVFTDARFATGAIGVRDFNASASWRDVRAVADGVPEVGAP